MDTCLKRTKILVFKVSALSRRHCIFWQTLSSFCFVCNFSIISIHRAFFFVLQLRVCLLRLETAWKFKNFDLQWDSDSNACHHFWRGLVSLTSIICEYNRAYSCLSQNRREYFFVNDGLEEAVALNSLNLFPPCIKHQRNDRVTLLDKVSSNKKLVGQTCRK